MLSQGLTLTFAGMAVVFSFLILLVLAMLLSSKIINRLFSDETHVPVPERKVKPDIALAVAVAAARAKKDGKLP